MAQASYSGVWDEQLIIREITAKNIALVILYFYAPALRADRNFTEGFLKAFKANYKLIGRTEIPGQELKSGSSMFFYVPGDKT